MDVKSLQGPLDMITQVRYVKIKKYHQQNVLKASKVIPKYQMLRRTQTLTIVASWRRTGFIYIIYSESSGS